MRLLYVSLLVCIFSQICGVVMGKILLIYQNNGCLLGVLYFISVKC
jgi:hypothetical protein